MAYEVSSSRCAGKMTSCCSKLGNPSVDYVENKKGRKEATHSAFAGKG
jgi:hypothetical protein